MPEERDCANTDSLIRDVITLHVASERQDDGRHARRRDSDTHPERHAHIPSCVGRENSY